MSDRRKRQPAPTPTRNQQQETRGHIDGQRHGFEPLSLDILEGAKDSVLVPSVGTKFVAEATRAL